jgi:hypothetical protein
MADKTVARTIVAEACRVLDRQNVLIINAGSRVAYGLFNNFVHGHLPVSKKPANPNFASAVSTNATDRNTPRANPDKSVMKEAGSLIQSTVSKM